MANPDSLPPFLEQPLAPAAEVKRTTAPGRGVAWGVTALWLLAGATYVHFVLAWNLTQLRPVEALGLVCGLVLPLAILWQAVVSVENGRLLRQETQAIAAQLRELLYPAAEHEARVRTAAESLKSQAKAMTTASAEAASRAQAERIALRLQTEEMERLADRIEAAFAVPLQSLRHEVARVDEVTGTAVARAREVEERLAVQVKEAARASETTVNVVQDSFGRIAEDTRGFEMQTQAVCKRLEAAAVAVGARLAQLEEAGGKVGNHFEKLGLTLDSHGTIVADACSRAETTAASLERRGEELQQGFARRSETLSAMVDRLGADGERLLSALQQRAKDWEAAMAAAERSGVALADRVAASADRLRDAGGEAVETVDALNRRIAASGDSLETAAITMRERLSDAAQWFEASGHAMKQAAADMGQEARDLTSAGDTAAARLAELHAALNRQLQAFDSAAGQAERAAAAVDERTRGMTEQLANNGRNLSATAERLTREVGEAAAAVERSATRLEENTGRARDSLGVAERAVSQQAEQLSAAVGAAAQNLDDAGRGLELRRQALTQTAQAIEVGLTHVGDGIERRRAEIEDMAARLEQGLLGFTAMAGGAAETVQACVDALAEHAGALGKAFDQGEGVVAGLGERGDELSEAVGRLVGEAAAAAAALGRETEQLRQTAVEIAERTRAAENEIGAGTQGLVAACKRAVDTVTASTAALAGEGDGLASRIEPVCRRLTEVATVLAAGREELVKAGAALLPVGETTAERIATVTNGLATRHAEALAIAERAAEIATQTSAAEAVLGARAAELLDACGKAVEELSAATAALAAERQGVAQMEPIHRRLADLAKGLAGERERLAEVGAALLPAGEATAQRLAAATDGHASQYAEMLALVERAAEIAELTNRADATLSGSAAELVATCHQAVTSVTQATAALAGERDGLSRVAPLCKRLADLAATLKIEREALVEAGTALLPAGDHTVAKLAEVAHSLAQRHADALAVAERTAEIAAQLDGRGVDLGEALTARAAVLVETANQTVQAIDSGVERALTAAEQLAGMTEALAQASEAARAAVPGTPALVAEARPAGEPAATEDGKTRPTGFGLKLLYGMAQLGKDEDEKKK